MYPGKATNKEISRCATTAMPFKSGVDSVTVLNDAICIPAANIIETPDEYLLEIAAPGMQREDFNIEIEELVISIFAKSEKSSATNSITEHCEYNYSEWSRAFALPEDADVVLAHAKYSNGELIIRIPRNNSNEKSPKATVYVY